jgi:hypothetical protein
MKMRFLQTRDELSLSHSLSLYVRVDKKIPGIEQFLENSPFLC